MFVNYFQKKINTMDELKILQTLQQVFPTIQKAVLSEYLNVLPPENNRLQLCLKHFYTIQDVRDKLIITEENEGYSELIQTIFPNVPHNEIDHQLAKLTNLRGREHYVIRKFLKKTTKRKIIENESGLKIKLSKHQSGKFSVLDSSSEFSEKPSEKTTSNGFDSENLDRPLVPFKFTEPLDLVKNEKVPKPINNPKCIEETALVSNANQTKDNEPAPNVMDFDFQKIVMTTPNTQENVTVNDSLNNTFNDLDYTIIEKICDNFIKRQDSSNEIHSLSQSIQQSSPNGNGTNFNGDNQIDMSTESRIMELNKIVESYEQQNDISKKEDNQQFLELENVDVPGPSKPSNRNNVDMTSDNKNALTTYVKNKDLPQFSTTEQNKSVITLNDSLWVEEDVFFSPSTLDFLDKRPLKNKKLKRGKTILKKTHNDRISSEDITDLTETPPKLITPIVNGVIEVDKTLSPPISEDLPIAANSPQKIIQDIQVTPVDQISPVAGPSKIKKPKTKKIDEKLYHGLIEMFPETCPEHIKKLCGDFSETEENSNSITDMVISALLDDDNHPKRAPKEKSPEREVNPDEQFQIVKDFLPDADPEYLRRKCIEFEGKPDALKQFIDDCLEHHSYPTMKEYLRKQQLSAQQRQYTTEFSVRNFIKLFPNPHQTFNDPKRNVNVKDTQSLLSYTECFLRNMFRKHSVNTLRQVMRHHPKIITMVETLRKTPENLSSRRGLIIMPETQNIPLLQDCAYISHKEEIDNYLLQIKKKAEEEKAAAKAAGLLVTCQCCYDDEVMPNDSFECAGKGCCFCKDCIQKSVEVQFGEGKLEYSCLAGCKEEFSVKVLQAALPPNLFSKWAQKKTLAEVKSAGIEELEQCPFCDFATIPPEGDKIFKCMNSECMKEHCRLCKEPSHVPLKCEEVEKDDDVKKRVYIENQMTEALLRTCPNCKVKFYKEDGCNKMTCRCGAHMCYICKKPVKNYDHFNGQGGDKFHLCPLYSDTIEVNKQNVLKGAANAKKEVGATDEELKIDPTADVDAYFKERAKKIPRPPHLDIAEMGIGWAVNQYLDQRAYFRHPPVPVQRQPPPAHAPRNHAQANQLAAGPANRPTNLIAQRPQVNANRQAPVAVNRPPAQRYGRHAQRQVPQARPPVNVQRNQAQVNPPGPTHRPNNGGQLIQAIPDDQMGLIREQQRRLQNYLDRGQ